MTEINEHVEVLLKKLDPELPTPRYANPGDAGLDLYAREDATLAPGERAAVATGVAVALPAGYAGFVHPRSGLALKKGLTIVNAPGTIDAGYRGEIKVIVMNTDRNESIIVKRGERIAQLVIQHVSIATLIEVESLPGSVRGQGGFGSSGSETLEGRA